MTALPLPIAQSMIEGMELRATRLWAMRRNDEAVIVERDIQALREHYGLTEFKNAPWDFARKGVEAMPPALPCRLRAEGQEDRLDVATPPYSEGRRRSLPIEGNASGHPPKQECAE